MAGKNDGQSNTAKAQAEETARLAEETAKVQEKATSPALQKALDSFVKSGKDRMASFWALAVAFVAESARGWKAPALFQACAARGVQEIESVETVKALLGMPEALGVLTAWGIEKAYLMARFHVSAWIPLARIVAWDKSDKVADKAAYRARVKALLEGTSQGAPTVAVLRNFLNIEKGNGKSGNVSPIGKAGNGENQTLDVSKATEGALCEMAHLLFARAVEIGPDAVAKLADCVAGIIDAIEAEALEEQAKTEAKPETVQQAA